MPKVQAVVWVYYWKVILCAGYRLEAAPEVPERLLVANHSFLGTEIFMIKNNFSIIWEALEVIVKLYFTFIVSKKEGSA